MLRIEEEIQKLRNEMEMRISPVKASYAHVEGQEEQVINRLPSSLYLFQVLWKTWQISEYV